MILTDIEQSISTTESLDLMEGLESKKDGILIAGNLYENSGVHSLILKEVLEIQMLCREEIHSKAKIDEYEAMIEIQNTSPEQTASALAIPEQTTIGKEISNPFMAGSLPKTTKPP
ncbi:hypothetical protein Tco_0528115 [Tanacetum coccineum]